MNKDEYINLLKKDGTFAILTDNITDMLTCFDIKNISYSECEQRADVYNFTQALTTVCSEDHTYKAFILAYKDKKTADFLRNRLISNRYHAFIIDIDAKQYADICDKISLEELYNPIVVPIWAKAGNNGYTIDENAFVSEFKHTHKNLKNIGNTLYDDYGYISNGSIIREIQEIIQPYITKSLNKRATDLFDALRTSLYISSFTPQDNKIYCKNGCLTIQADGSVIFDENDDSNTVNRFNLNYKPNYEQPKLWTDFLNGMFYDDDVPTIQEYLGYCLLPTGKITRYLHIKGNGNEGKSRIGRVMERIFLNSAVETKLKSIETDKFELSRFRHKLIAIADESEVIALNETSTLKSLIDGATMTTEAKYMDKVDVKLYCRLLSFGNKDIYSTNDDTFGWYRRLVLVTTKPNERKGDIVDYDKVLYDAEAEQIFNWMIDGAVQLAKSNYKLVISSRTQDNIKRIADTMNPSARFIEEYTKIAPNSAMTTRDLKTKFEVFAFDNGYEAKEIPRLYSKLLDYLKDNQYTLGIKVSTNIAIGTDGKHARGYRGRKLI